MNKRIAFRVDSFSVRLFFSLVCFLVLPCLAHAVSEGNEGGDCVPDGPQGKPWCPGYGASCLATAIGNKCVKCGGKGERCCDPLNTPDPSGCFNAREMLDDKFRMSCINGLCQNTSEYGARNYCGHPGYPGCVGPGGRLYCYGTSFLEGRVCVATGRFYQPCNQGDQPVDPDLLCDSDGAECKQHPTISNYYWCVPRTVPLPPGQILGKWRWFNGVTVTVEPDGTIWSTSNHGGHWRVISPTKRTYEFNWNQGPDGPWLDTLTLSQDGQHLKGHNQYGNSVSGDR